MEDASDPASGDVWAQSYSRVTAPWTTSGFKERTEKPSQVQAGTIVLDEDACSLVLVSMFRLFDR